MSDATDTGLSDHTLTYDEGDDGQAPGSDGAEPESRYVLGEEHARGGIGRILRARDLKLGRDVAIKELISSSARAQARFDREARITARLEHPAIVPVHDAGRWRDNGRPYLAMKLVSGRSLRDAIAGARTLAERLALLPSVVTVADAIGYAHSVGVIHRDLKPSNILVGDYGETVVIDWGLAKELDRPADEDDPLEAGPYRVGDDHVTIAGTVVGTPAFMSPEQARGHGADQRSDVYALGAVLYSLLAGRAPYEGSSDDVVDMVREGPPVPLPALAAGVPPDLAAIVGKAMARDPAQRYPDAAALAGDLRRYRTGQLVGAHDYSWAQLVGRWTRRNRALTVAFVLFLVALAGASGWFLSREKGLRRAAEAERDRAAAERDRADAQTLVLLEQQGRRELAEHRPFRAAPYLAEALRRAPDRAAPRWLVSEALRAMHAHQRSLSGHDADVVGADLSPDGALAITASTDRSARIWDVGSGREVSRRDLGGRLEAAAFSPDGDLVAAGGEGVVTLWSARTGELRYRVEAEVHRMAFSRDGAHLLVGSNGSEVTLVDTATGAVLHRWKRRDGRVSGLTWEPDNHHFVASFDIGEVVRGDATAGTLDQVLISSDETISAVEVSPDGRQLLVASFGEDYSILDLASGKTVTRHRLPDGAQIASVAYLPGGRAFAAGAIDGVVRIVHARSGAVLAAFDAFASGRLNRIAVDRDGHTLLTAGVGGKADIWGLDDLGFRVHAVAGAPDHAFISTCQWLDEGRLIGVGHDDGTLAVRDAATDRVLRSVVVDSNVTCASFDRRGERVVNNGSAAVEPRTSLWDLASGERVATFDAHTQRVYHSDASADGERVATSSYDGTVRQWRMTDGAAIGAVLRSIDGRRFAAVAYAPDRRRIATADEDGEVQVWDRDSGEELIRFAAHPSWIQDLAFSPDSRRIVTGGRLDLMARVWDSTTGERLLSVEAQRGNVMSVGFSPDGRVLASTGTDNRLNLRDATTGELLRTIEGPRMKASFHPAAPELVACGPDEYLVSWDDAIDERSPESIGAEVARLSPWTLEDGRLVLAGAEAP